MEPRQDLIDCVARYKVEWTSLARVVWTVRILHNSTAIQTDHTPPGPTKRVEPLLQEFGNAEVTTTQQLSRQVNGLHLRHPRQPKNAPGNNQTQGGSEHSGCAL